MAKTPYTGNRLKAARAHYLRTAGFVKLVRKLYDYLAKEGARMALDCGYDPDLGLPIRLKDWPDLNHSAKRLRSTFSQGLQAIILRGTSEEWMEGDLMADLLANGALKVYKIGKSERLHWYQDHAPALEGFQQRKVGGMNLSQRIWLHTEESMRGLEAALSAGMEKGMSAVTLSKRVSKYLKDFEALRADYTERFGKATDAVNCEYRSVRLARTEINMAYRVAEQTRWSDMDFVLGYEVKRSGGLDRGDKDLKPYDCDLCESLAGKYPKDFDFKGWHPNCRCYTVPIIMDDKEFWDADAAEGSPNMIKYVPDNFKEWVTDNEERLADMERRGTLPWFVRDNKDRIV